ncbi:MAG: hypothetical protein KGD64_04975 [Candidatus Heimdallarchaeota archaeon]|nr:hypothetical protein [Candidatus Heimdallarchaeota archaeon]
MEIWVIALIDLGVLFVFLNILFGLSQLLKNNNILDIGYGLAYALIAIVTLVLKRSYTVRSMI